MSSPSDSEPCDHVVGIYWDYSQTHLVIQSRLAEHVAASRLSWERIRARQGILAGDPGPMDEKTDMQQFAAFEGDVFKFCPHCGERLPE